MITQNFKVTAVKEDIKPLPLGTIGFTKNSNGEAYLLIGTNDPSIEGELIAYAGVPYRGLDPTVQYYIRIVDSTFSAGIVVE